MYNRYIPENVSYTRVEAAHPPKSPRTSGPGAGGGHRQPLRLPDFLSGKESLSGLFGGGERGGLSSLLKVLHLDSVDTGDVLLLLIMLYLMAEGDDLDLVIALGLTLLMGLGEEKEE